MNENYYRHNVIHVGFRLRMRNSNLLAAIAEVVLYNSCPSNLFIDYLTR